MKLNLGCGSLPLEGYENLDAKTGQSIYPLQYADGSADEIRASHVLEHFGWREAFAVITEWVRVLKPGGVLKIAVPDFQKISRLYLSGQTLDAQGFVMGGQTDELDYHKTIYDREVLTDALQKAGLGRIQTWTSELQDCAAYPISLNLQGEKLGPLPDFKVRAVMSVPRLGFNDNTFCWAQALMPLGIHPTSHTGAFWGQCIERVMTQFVDECDWILTLDYDTVFTRKHVEDLIRTALEYPDIDALAPIQIGRQRGTPLMTVAGDDGKPACQVDRELFDFPLIPATTAHFGLTLIRTAALKKLAHPWFWSTPNEDGLWEEGRQDDDTYFWVKWREAGNNLHVASRVPVGHLELLATWPDKNLRPIYQHPSEFRKNGAPKEAWE